jgi:hypothetical protein
VIAKNLARKGAKMIPLEGGGFLLKGGGNLEKGAKVVLRGTSKSGPPTVSVQYTNLKGDITKKYKFRTQKAGWLFK